MLVEDELMPELVAVQRVTYARRNYLPGQRFTASHLDAKVLIAGGMARVESVAALAQEPEVQRAAPDEVIEPPKRKRGRPRKGEYARRDMQAD